MVRGATWGKWDLHIHTPASYEWAAGKRLRDATTPEERNIILREVVEGINASGCVAVAVMDYWSFDGIIALRQYLKQPGAVQCKAAIFPGIELRMVSPGAFRLNMHVLLNPTLSDEKLQAFKAQIRLSITDMPLTDDYLVEWAREYINEKRLDELATTRATVLASRSAALIAASKTVEVSPESVKSALRQFGRSEAILFVPFDTSDGVGKIKFREHHSFPSELLAMEAIYEVGNEKTRDAFVGIRTTANEGFFDEFQEAIKLPKLAVRGSDAHSVADYGRFPNGRATWIKASPTFEGLLQACKEPANRSHYGNLPPKLDFVARNPHLFIESVQVRKRTGAPELGAWFDGTNLQLNHDLVALIGKKGSGKSALADVLGLLGDTLNFGHFSFLSPQRFRLPKDNKAHSFEALLQWKKNTKAAEWRQLSSARSPSAVQRVKYLPQRYFEELCNDHVAGDDHLLQNELKEVIFSHIPFDERDSAHSLDDLISKRSESIEREIAEQRSRLSTLNSRILTLAVEVTPDAQSALRESVRLSIVRLRALRANMPVVDTAPSINDDVTQLATQRIESLNNEIKSYEEKCHAAETKVESSKATLRSIEDVSEHLSRIEKSFLNEKVELEAKLAALNLDVNDVIRIRIDRSKIDEVRLASAAIIEQEHVSLDPVVEGSLSAKLAALRIAKLEEQAKMNEPMRLHQEALTRLQEWQVEWSESVGHAEQPNSFTGLWTQLRAMGYRRIELETLTSQRLSLSVAILVCLKQRAPCVRIVVASSDLSTS